MRRLVLWSSLGLMLLAGCEPENLVTRPDSGVLDGSMSEQTTYYGDVRPILVANCTMCHMPGGIAPFQLQTYAEAVEVADRMRDATAARIMPPFLADNSGDCNTWQNFRGLTEEEIDTIARWVRQGTPEGDPTIAAPEPGVLPTLSTVSATLTMERYDIATGIDDDYRCFVVDPGITEAGYVTGYDVHPGNAQKVHHVIVYNPTDDAEAADAMALDAANGSMGDGYPCFGGPRIEAPPLVLWAPGTGATRFPRGTGIQVAPNRPMIVQVHYNNLVEEAENDDLTTIDLQIEPTASPAYFAPVWDLDLNLPPAMPSVTESATIGLSWLPISSIRVWGMMPHMHTLGRQLNVTINRASGEDECLIDVPRWDFGWQLAYWLDRPIRVEDIDSATITCTYNTMSRRDMTHWGDGTQDEMCLAFMYVTL